jgi:hypothetical protein
MDETGYSGFFPLLQRGFHVKTKVGISVRDLLCEQFAISPEYLADRIKTIFLNGQPVDDVENTALRDGSVLALSAAMPGLVGATFRRGGGLASFRSGITYHQEDLANAGEAATVTIKLFNLLAEELGPVFLKAGIWMNPEEAADFFRERLDSLTPALRGAEVDGREIAPADIASAWKAEAGAGEAFLRVQG